MISLGPGCDIKLVQVPEGPFIYGRLPEQLDNGNPVPAMTVWLPTYYMSQYPITIGIWDRYCELHHTDNTVQGTKVTSEAREKLQLTPLHPMTKATWYEAADFCRWIGEQVSLKVDLPTETQWEKAARGTDGRLYPWGDADVPQEFTDHYPPTFPYGPEGPGMEPDYILGDKIELYERVGMELASEFWGWGEIGALGVQSPFGCFDMCINTYEWTRDWINWEHKEAYVEFAEEHPETILVDPPSPAEPTPFTSLDGRVFKVLRGGPLWDGKRVYRGVMSDPGQDPLGNGFRIVIAG